MVLNNAKCLNANNVTQGMWGVCEVLIQGHTWDSVYEVYSDRVAARRKDRQ